MRKTRLLELNPRWANSRWRDGEAADAISFDCPEADGGCDGRHVIPVSHRKDGTPAPHDVVRWRRIGDDFATMSLDQSVRCAGACRMHIQISNGRITFCEDSKSGPDWSDK